MKYIIAYDIPETKIRSKIAKYLEGVAYRIQFSVFMGDFSENEANTAKTRIMEIIGNPKKRMVVMIPVCKNCEDKIWKVGQFREEEALVAIA
jgi:CRISPR-associated protein Cas2